MKLQHDKQEWLKDLGRFFAALAFLFIFAIYFFDIFPNSGWNFLVWILGILVLLWILKILGISLARRTKGMEGEKAVEKILGTLPKNYIRLGDLLLGERGNIDEIVIGPTGIWVVEVKSHKGKIGFNGRQLLRNGRPFERDFIGQAKSEALTVRDVLRDRLHRNFFIQAVIVFEDKRADLNFAPDVVKGIYVVDREKLINLILSNEVWLDTKTINEIVRVLNLSDRKR